MYAQVLGLSPLDKQRARQPSGSGGGGWISIAVQTKAVVEASVKRKTCNKIFFIVNLQLMRC